MNGKKRKEEKKGRGGTKILIEKQSPRSCGKLRNKQPKGRRKK